MLFICDLPPPQVLAALPPAGTTRVGVARIVSVARIARAPPAPAYAVRINMHATSI